MGAGRVWMAFRQLKEGNMKHIGTDKEPNTAEADVIDEVWVRDEHGKLVKLEVTEDDAETGQ